MQVDLCYEKEVSPFYEKQIMTHVMRSRLWEGGYDPYYEKEVPPEDRIP